MQPTPIPKQRIVILGATGSIGDNALKVIDTYPESLELIAIAAEHNFPKLSEIAHKYNVPHVGITNTDAYTQAKSANIFPSNCKLHTENTALEYLATLPNADIVLIATNGIVSLPATLAAIHANKRIALANKETLVLAGTIIMQALKKNTTQLLPVDSEHSAIFQCLNNQPPSTVSQVILTASGGAFRDYSPEQLSNVTLHDALKHPTWSMGQKITVDSATMVNKALEMIEALWLFDLSPHQINAVIHRQSFIHSFVEFIDGSIIAQMNPPSMTLPIQYAFFYPHRHSFSYNRFNFQTPSNFNIEPINSTQYPCFELIKDVLLNGPKAHIIYNAANDAAVKKFIQGKIKFTQIYHHLQYALNKFSSMNIEINYNNILDLHHMVYEDCLELNYTKSQI